MRRKVRAVLCILILILCLLASCSTQPNVPCLTEPMQDGSIICNTPSNTGIPINDDFSILVTDTSIRNGENQSVISLKVYIANIGTHDAVLLPNQLSVLTASKASFSVAPPPRTGYGSAGSFPLGLPIRPAEIVVGTVGFDANETVSYPFVVVAYASSERTNPTYIRIDG